jgi:hypothetical protein
MQAMVLCIPVFGVAGTDRTDAIKVVVEFSLQFHSCVVGSC